MEEYEITAKKYRKNIDVSLFQKYRHIDVDIDVSPDTKSCGRLRTNRSLISQITNLWSHLKIVRTTHLISPVEEWLSRSFSISNMNVFPLPLVELVYPQTCDVFRHHIYTIHIL